MATDSTVDRRSFEIWEVYGDTRDDLWLLVHSEEDPDDTETFRASVVRVVGEKVWVERQLNTWTTAMWRSAAGDVYLGDMDFKIHVNRGGQWTTTELDVPGPSAIFGVSAADVYCSGWKGKFFRFAGDRWVLSNDGLPKGADLYAIGGSDRGDVYVLGTKGAIFHNDGVRWAELDSPTDVTLTNLLSESPNQTYFSGRKGSFFRLRGTEWNDLSLPDKDISLRGIASYRDRIYVGSHLEIVFILEGNNLVPVRPEVPASLRVIDDRLFAFGNNVIEQYDGDVWSRREFDFAEIIGRAT
jgi:hypothetical protein